MRKAKVAVSSETHTKPSAHFDHHAEFFNFKPGGK
jgi:hypothetical protein